MKPLLAAAAIALSACSSVPRAPELVKRVCHEAQVHFNVPEQSDHSWYFGKCEVKHCDPFVAYLRPQLTAAGATDVRLLEMSVAGQRLTHVALRFHADGRDWIVDNRRLAHAFGRTPQEEVEYFCNPFHETTANVTLLNETK